MSASSTLSMSRCNGIDDSFGPAASGCRFDFTLLFEESILFLGPSIVFQLLAIWRVLMLRKKKCKVQQDTILQNLKAGATLGYIFLQTALLVLWTRPGIYRTRVSIVAAVFGLLNALVVLGLSFLEHNRSIRPSTLLQIYFVLSLLCDIARARTLWLIGTSTAIASVFSTAVVVKLCITSLESTEKRRILISEYKGMTLESTSSVVNISIFWWLNNLLRSGAKNIFAMNDLEDVKQKFHSNVLHTSLEAYWPSGIAKLAQRHAFLFAVLKTFRWQILAGVFPRLCMTAFNFTQPFLMNTLLNWLDTTDSAEKKNAGYGLIGAYAIVFLGIAISQGRYSYKMSQVSLLIRGSLTSVIYYKALDLDLTSVDDSSTMTLMSVDVERICRMSQGVHQLWANPVELGLAVWLLERQLGVSCIVPVVLALACAFASMKLSSHMGKAQGKWLAATKKRLQAIESLLGSIKSSKMMGLTTRLLKVIRGLREAEIQSSFPYRNLNLSSIVLSEVTNVMAPVLTFSLFTIISGVKKEQSLLVSQAFTSLTILNLLGVPLVAFIQTVPMIGACVASFSRIQELLTSDSYKSPSRSSSFPTHEQAGYSKDEHNFVMRDLRSGPVVLSVADGAFGWKSGKPVLRDINFTVPKGTFVAVVGPVGSGKSTLLKGLLGETLLSAGSVVLPSPEVAFCDQTAWILNTTLRANILGPCEFDAPWYEKILYACALNEDLKALPRGDECLLGSKGIALSGGQKMRIAIARALYARKSVAFFDDVLAGLDSSTEELLFQRVFGPRGILRQHGTTVIMVTNRVAPLRAFDHVLALNQSGTITEQGNYDTFSSHHGIDNLPLTSPLVPDAQEEVKSPRPDQTSPATGIDNPTDKLRQVGDWSIYKYYFKSTGWFNAFFTLIMAIVNAFCVVFSTIWLQNWAQSNTKGSTEVMAKYPVIYALLGVLALITLALFCRHGLNYMIPRSSKILHDIVLTTMLSAPLSFFSKTDTGITMNMFSQDMQLVDASMQIGIINTVEGIAIVLLRLIVVCITAKYISATIPLTALVVYLIQRYYLRTSRQLRILDIEAKAPLYSHFLETLNGLATIRAFGWEGNFKARAHTILDESQKPYYLLACIQRWLTFVLDCLSGMLGLLIVVLAVMLKGKGGMSPGETGVALINVMSFNAALAQLIINWTMLETSIGAVSRIKSFAASTQSEVRQAVRPDPMPSWPQHGAIEMENVVASYDTKSPKVLKDVSVSIRAGERIGICGRTGSGKSSFVLSILQVLELHSGSIVIDDIDLSSISRESVRNRIITVPQDFALLDEPIRSALDPNEEHADDMVTEALQKVHIWDILQERHGLATLGSQISISHGQRQLFALARAILSPGSIVILDEACSSVDAATNDIMQAIIRGEFKGKTILAVDHRLSNILDFDKILLLDQGAVVEFDTPDALLGRDSSFKALYTTSEK